jgi:hypothetical protein
VEFSQIDSESLANKLLLAVAAPAVAAAVELRERRYFPTAITRPANRCGLTTSGESFEPNGTQLTLPHAVMLRRGREHRPQYSVAVLTNAIRKQVPEFWRVIRACQDNATRMTHSLIDDIYAYLHVTRAREMDAIDILLQTVIPFVENGLGEPMKGSIQTRERQVLRDWAATAARKRTESHDKSREICRQGYSLVLLCMRLVDFSLCSTLHRSPTGTYHSVLCRPLRQESVVLGEQYLKPSLPPHTCPLKTGSCESVHDLDKCLHGSGGITGGS